MSKRCYYQGAGHNICESPDSTYRGQPCPAIFYEYISVEDCIQSRPVVKER